MAPRHDKEKTPDTYAALTAGAVLSLLWLAGFVMATPSTYFHFGSRWYDIGRAVTLMSPGIYVAMFAGMVLTGGMGHGSYSPWLLGFIAELVNFPAYSALSYVALRLARRATKGRWQI